MKRYIQPSTKRTPLTVANILCASGKTTETMGLNQTAGSGESLTRSTHRGFGNGLWEDMQ